MESALEENNKRMKAAINELIKAFSITRSDDFIFIETRQGAFGQVDDIGYWSESADSGDLRRYNALDEILKAAITE